MNEDRRRLPEHEGKGYKVWGETTTLNKPSALDHLNVAHIFKPVREVDLTPQVSPMDESVYATDIDMLHKNWVDPTIWSSHRSGKTTVMIHKLAGQIMFGNIPRIHIMLRETLVKFILYKIAYAFDTYGIRIAILKPQNGLKELVCIYENKRVILNIVKNYKANPEWLETPHALIYDMDKRNL